MVIQPDSRLVNSTLSSKDIGELPPNNHHSVKDLASYHGYSEATIQTVIANDRVAELFRPFTRRCAPGGDPARFNFGQARNLQDKVKIAKT